MGVNNIIFGIIKVLVSLINIIKKYQGSDYNGSRYLFVNSEDVGSFREINGRKRYLDWSGGEGGLGISVRRSRLTKPARGRFR